MQFHFKPPAALTDTFTVRDFTFTFTGTMRHYFGKFQFTCRHILFWDIFRGHLESGQTSNNLTSKTGSIFLGRAKILRTQTWKLTVKSGRKISIWRRTCVELRRDFLKERPKHIEWFCRFRDFHYEIPKCPITGANWKFQILTFKTSQLTLHFCNFLVSHFFNFLVCNFCDFCNFLRWSLSKWPLLIHKMFILFW